MLWAGAAFLLVALPVGLFLAVNSFGWQSIRTPILSIPRLTGVPRFQSMGNLHVFSAEFLRQAAANLGQAAELFRSQDDGLIWNAIPGYGILYGLSTLLALAGLALLVGKGFGPARRASFPLLAWSIAALVLMAFVSPNINRANAAMLPFIFCVAIASALLWQTRSLAILLCVLLAGSCAGFVGAYFGNYRQTAAEPFFASFGEAIRYASEQSKGDVCVTDHVNMPYIFALFYTKEDPRVFERTVHYDNLGAEFQSVSSFGRFRFGIGRCADSAGAIVARPDEVASWRRDGFTVKEFERYVVLVRPNRDSDVGLSAPSHAEPLEKARNDGAMNYPTFGMLRAASGSR
jgi:hypothetical protein